MAGTWHEDESSLADEAETQIKHATLDSFSKYRQITHYNTTHRRRQNLYSLPSRHWQLLAASPINIQSKLNRVDDAIDTNAKIAEQIVKHSIEAFGISEDDKAWRGTAKSNDHDKARSTIRQFYRDWSAAGRVEREGCYGPVLEDLKEIFPDANARDKVRVLVPGAGLGRLLVELVGMGFEVEGNELSFHQMMGSNWVLNGLGPEEKYELYPWALSFSNQVTAESQMRCVTVPDVHPGMYLHEKSEGRPRHAYERMSMTAGDFCLLYAEEEYKGSFGAVATVFFVDTAPNLIRYIETIKNCLEDGGYWISLGPLLWHFEDRGPGNGDEDKAEANGDRGAAKGGLGSKGIADPGSVELTAEEVLLLVAHMGFEVLKHEIKETPQGYIQDPDSMLTTSYKVLHFVARRKAGEAASI